MMCVRATNVNSKNSTLSSNSPVMTPTATITASSFFEKKRMFPNYPKPLLPQDGRRGPGVSTQSAELAFKQFTPTTCSNQLAASVFPEYVRVQAHRRFCAAVRRALGIQNGLRASNITSTMNGQT